MNDGSTAVIAAFALAFLGFVAGVWVGAGHGERRAVNGACGVCDDGHKADECGLYVCTQEGWR